MGSLFHSLPDEIGRECLVRVELNSHHILRCVCKSWNAVLNSPQFYQQRKRLKISEQRICMIDDRYDSVGVIVYDLAEKSCKNLPPIPARSHRIYHCHFVKQKLVLITDVLPDTTRSCVWLYDFACSKWRQGAKMLRWRYGFASAADEDGGLIYVGGGYNRLDKPVVRASVYNVEEDRWDLLPDMNTCMEEFGGAFADGKFYVMGKPSGPSFEIFDSCTRSWKTMENRFNSRHFVRAFGRLYFFSPRGLIEYDCSQDKLNIVGPVPMEEWHLHIHFAIEVGHNIYLSRWDYTEDHSFCTLALQSETGGAFKWIGIERPSGLQGMALRAATLDL